MSLQEALDDSAVFAHHSQSLQWEQFDIGSIMKTMMPFSGMTTKSVDPQMSSHEIPIP